MELIYIYSHIIYIFTSYTNILIIHYLRTAHPQLSTAFIRSISIDHSRNYLILISSFSHIFQPQCKEAHPIGLLILIFLYPLDFCIYHHSTTFLSYPVGFMCAKYRYILANLAYNCFPASNVFVVRSSPVLNVHTLLDSQSGGCKSVLVRASIHTRNACCQIFFCSE